MSPISKNRREASDRIATEAADWWSRLELGSADLDAFNGWRESDPAHAIAFARVQATWESLQNHRTDVETQLVERGSRRRFLRNAVAAAAAVGLVGAAGLLYTSRAMAWSRASTAVGGFRKVRLPDSSTLELNTDTSLSWRFNEDVRSLRIERGEIAMELVAGAPITLDVAVATLSLTPGSFNARLIDGRVGVTVLEGRATGSVLSDGVSQTVVVESGQSAEWGAGLAKIQPTTPADRERLTAWRTGSVVFDDLTLAAAVAEYNRYLSRKIVVADPVLATMRVGGRFATSDPTAFLHAVSAALDADIRSDAGSIQIVRK
jgi:transmembrane sensor